MTKNVKTPAAPETALPPLPQAGGSYILENGVLRLEQPETDATPETAPSKEA